MGMQKENIVVKKVRHSRKFLSGIPTLDIQNVEDPRLRASGMTPLFNKGAFTLIELLVVVLIIGILAAVAVPQYQKAVNKSQVIQLFVLVKYLKNQQELYYLGHGYYAADCAELAPEMPTVSPQYSFMCSNGNGSRVLGKLKNGTIQLDLEAWLDKSSRPGQWLCTPDSRATTAIQERTQNLCSLIGVKGL